MKFRWLAIGIVLSYVGILLGVAGGYEPKSLMSRYPLGSGLLVSVFFVALAYLCLISPIRQIIRELQAGWSLIDCLIYHCVALGFLVFFLLPMVMEAHLSEQGGHDYYWGFIICCLIKLGSLLNRRQYRQRVERTNEYLACLRDPHGSSSVTPTLGETPGPGAGINAGPSRRRSRGKKNKVHAADHFAVDRQRLKLGVGAGLPALSRDSHFFCFWVSRSGSWPWNCLIRILAKNRRESPIRMKGKSPQESRRRQAVGPAEEFKKETRLCAYCSSWLSWER